MPSSAQRAHERAARGGEARAGVGEDGERERDAVAERVGAAPDRAERAQARRRTRARAPARPGSIASAPSRCSDRREHAVLAGGVEVGDRADDPQVAVALEAEQPPGGPRRGARGDLRADRRGERRLRSRRPRGRSRAPAPGDGVKRAKIPPPRPPARGARQVDVPAGAAGAKSRRVVARERVVVAVEDGDHAACVSLRRVQRVERSAYFSLTTLRLTFSVGVSSPVSCERSWSRIANFLTCSTCAYFVVGLVELGLDQRAHLRVAGRARRSTCPRGPARCAHGTISSSSSVTSMTGYGPAVAVHDRLRDPAALLHVVLDVRGREVLAAGGDDDVLLAAGDRRGSRPRRSSRGRRCAASRRRRRRSSRRRCCGSRRRCSAPLMRSSPSSAILQLDAGERAADRAELVLLERRERRRPSTVSVMP